MSLSLLKAARIVPALRAAAIVAACIVLQLSSSHAQTPAPEAAANPNEILTFEQMRVPRWARRNRSACRAGHGRRSGLYDGAGRQGIQPAAGQQGPHLAPGRLGPGLGRRGPNASP